MKTESLPNPNVIVDLNDRTIRPETPDGDDFFGLAMGANGTAAETRREIVIGQLRPPEHARQLRWLRSNGHAPRSLQIRPGNGAPFENPWIPSSGRDDE